MMLSNSNVDGDVGVGVEENFVDSTGKIFIYSACVFD